jgi:hypothetical protein
VNGLEIIDIAWKGVVESFDSITQTLLGPDSNESRIGFFVRLDSRNHVAKKIFQPIHSKGIQKTPCDSSLRFITLMLDSGR